MAGEIHTHTEWQGRLIGGGIALLCHLLLVLFFFTTGFRTIYPIPQDEGILVEFLPDPTPYLVPRATPGQEPRAPNPDQEVRLVQQATHVEEVLSQARTQQSTLGESGDVALLEPDTLKINERALFRSRDTGDSLANQSSRVVSATMQAGAPDGNTREGNPDGTPTARLQGRTAEGNLPQPIIPPTNETSAGGTVIVRILVDQYGKVTGASVSQTGTTVQDKILWDAAVKAALDSKFNKSDTSPAVQEGTITYVIPVK